MLKGAAVQARYARFAKRAEDFYDVSYSDADVITPQRVEQKTASLAESQRLRLVSFGRLIPRKGVDHTLRAVAKAVEQGTDLSLDIIGGGPEADRLTKMVSELKLQDRVTLTGPIAYDRVFLERLQGYDAFVFTPLGEDTPRAIFDALAAGLAIVGYDIPFVRQVCQQAGQPTPTPLGDVDALSQTILRLGRDRQSIVTLIQNAVEFARNNSAEQWYRRRAMWTHEVVEQKRSRKAMSSASNG
jgi:glycosyltransferase involved in cell wall biosynthesis